MIECVPEKVSRAVIYLHSAGVDSTELSPFLPKLVEDLPDTYIWAGDGVISGSPLMNNNAHYGDSERRYWFMFPMQDAQTQESFRQHSQATGASLLSSGAFLNRFVNQLAERFSLPSSKIVLCGFQHGSCLALAASMMRKSDPYRFTILFEPYILEAYYLESESVRSDTAVVCIENQHMRNRVKGWINIETDSELEKLGMSVTSIVVDGEEDKLNALMMDEAVKIVRSL